MDARLSAAGPKSIRREGGVVVAQERVRRSNEEVSYDDITHNPGGGG